MVLCDMKWLDPDMEEANGISATEQSDMLRLDALVLMVQLNVRKLIAVRAGPMRASADFMRLHRLLFPSTPPRRLLPTHLPVAFPWDIRVIQRLQAPDCRRESGWGDFPGVWNV